MLENLKEPFPWESYNKYGYISLMLFFGFSLILIGATGKLEGLKCSITLDSDRSTKIYIEGLCNVKYEEKYSFPLALRETVALNGGIVFIICLVYAVCMNKRIKTFKKLQTQTEDSVNNDENNKRRVSVFCAYIIHLIVRSLILILFGLLVAIYYDYPEKFVCPYSAAPFKNYKVNCVNGFALKRKQYFTAFCFMNFCLVLLSFLEGIIILKQILHNRNFTSDFEFCTIYLLRERKPLDILMKYYKDKLVFHVSMLPFGRKKHIKDIYIPLVIKNDRGSRLPKEISDRHEIYDVHLKRPDNTIANIEEIFKRDE